MLKAKKLLLILELNQTCLFLKDTKPINQHRQPQFKRTVINYDQAIVEDRFKVSYRRGRKDFLDFLFAEHYQKEIDVAVWTELSHQITEPLVKKYFGRYFRNLLFVTATDRKPYEMGQQDPTKHLKIRRDLNRIYGHFPGYGPENTVVIGKSQNMIEEHRRNDLIIPGYEIDTHDFENDPGVLPLIKYLKGLVMKVNIDNVTDIRNMIAAKQMSAMYKRFAHGMFSEREYN